MVVDCTSADVYPKGSTLDDHGVFTKYNDVIMLYSTSLMILHVILQLMLYEFTTYHNLRDFIYKQLPIVSAG